MNQELTSAVSTPALSSNSLKARPRKSPRHLRNRAAGFTLPEVAVAVAVLAMMAAVATPKFIEQYNESRAKITAQETQTIIDAARNYRLSEGKWPGNETCLDAITALKGTTPPLIAGLGSKNKFHSTVSTSCTATTFSVDQEIIKDWDGVVANMLPATEVVDTTKHLLRTTIGIPGTEPALDSKLSRIATGNAELNRMRTNLLLGGWNITEVDGIEANRANLSESLNVAGESQFGEKATFEEMVVLNKVVVENTSCPQTGAIARNAAGLTLSCQSGVWVANSKNVFEGPYRNVTGARTISSTYTNTGSAPLFVSIIGRALGNVSQRHMYAIVDGAQVARTSVSDAGVNWYNSPATLSFIVPSGSSYGVTTNGGVSITSWYELD